MKINAFVLEEDNEVVEESFIAESGHENSEVLDHKSDIPSLAALSLDAPEIASVSSSKESPEFFCASEAIRLQSGEEGLDMRPYLFDANSKAHILLDSGSQVCAWPPEPGDKVDPAIKLKAVMNLGYLGSIQHYSKQLHICIGYYSSRDSSWTFSRGKHP